MSVLAVAAVGCAAAVPHAQAQERDQQQDRVPPDDGAPAAVPMRAKIEWRVRNPFRFFNNHLDTEVHRATWVSLTPEQRRTPVSSAERALSARHVEGWAAHQEGKTCWSTANNRHVCPDAKPYVFPDSHTIVAELVEFPGDEKLTCTWLTAPKGRNVPRGRAIKQNCDKPVELQIPYPDGAQISVEIGGREVAEEDVRVRDVMIVGMGDSFGSGEGNPDVPVRFSRERAADYGKPDPKRSPTAQLVGFPARIGNWRLIGDKEFLTQNPRWIDQACHRSLYSHQLRAALQLALKGQQMDLNPLLQAAGSLGVSLGKSDLDVDLSSRGDSAHGFASNLAGKMVVQTGKGTIPLQGFKLLSGNLLRALLPGAEAANDLSLTCGTFRFLAERGVLNSNGMLIESNLTTVVGAGSVDLGQESINLNFKPQPKDGALGKLAPSVRVAGALAAPSVMIDAASAATNIAGQFLGANIPGTGGQQVPVVNPNAPGNPCTDALDHPVYATTNAAPTSAAGVAVEKGRNFVQEKLGKVLGGDKSPFKGLFGQ